MDADPAPIETRRRWRRWIGRSLLGLLVLVVALQVVPYGRSHSDPATTREPAWDSPHTRALFIGACGDCHSNLTTWPWYSNIAPVSWLTQRDVDSGRAAFDMSNWDRPQDVDIASLREAIQGGGMPPWFYKPLHPASRLSGADVRALITGLERTLAASPPIGGGG